MEPRELQGDVRSAISMAYELSRHEHVQCKEPVAQALGELEKELIRIEAKLGGERAGEVFPNLLGIAMERLSGVAEEAGPVDGDQIKALMKSVEQIAGGLALSRQVPSRPLLSVLPVRRVIPQDVHSIGDYAAALTVGAGVVVGESVEAKLASAALSGVYLGASACTDYPRSAAKLIPIEAHEAIDYVWGAAAIAAPFALGYYKKDPITAALHVFAGASTILMSLFTDYRSATGVGQRQRRPALLDQAPDK